MLSKHNSPTHFIPLPTQYQIPLTQSALNTQFPYTLPLPQIIQIPETICCQNIIPTLPSVLTLYQIHLTQSALSTKSTYHKVLLQFFLFQIFSPALSSLSQSTFSPRNYRMFHSHSNITQILICSNLIFLPFDFTLKFIYLCSTMRYNCDVWCNF